MKFRQKSEAENAQKVLSSRCVTKIPTESNELNRRKWESCKKWQRGKYCLQLSVHMRKSRICYIKALLYPIRSELQIVVLATEAGSQYQQSSIIINKGLSKQSAPTTTTYYFFSYLSYWALNLLLGWILIKIDCFCSQSIVFKFWEMKVWCKE